MVKVIVYGVAKDDLELLQLLDAADCQVIDEDYLFDPDVNEEDRPDALVVVLGPELEGDESLESSAIQAVSRSCRIVGVWPKGTASGTAPDCINKWSSAQVIWSADKVSAAVCGEPDPTYDTPSGEPRPAPDTPRNVCR